MELMLAPRVSVWLDKIAGKGAGVYLLYGPEAVGKHSAVIQLAKRLNCPTPNDGCGICRQIEVGNFPGVISVSPLPESKSLKIGIAQIQALGEELSLAGFYAGKPRIVVIDPADRMTHEAQNCLLKMIEEPPDSALIFLISTEPDLLLVTVRSRVQAIYFPELAEEELVELLKSGYDMPPETAAKAARLSRGKAGLAVKLAKEPESAKRFSQLAVLAKTALESDDFKRLMLVPRVTELDAGGLQFIEFLGAAISRRLRDGVLNSSDGSMQLAAIERATGYIAANVNPKATIEGLMLELGDVRG